MKENILFGQPFDVEKYSAVIYACALVEARNFFLFYPTKTPFHPLKSGIQHTRPYYTYCFVFAFFPVILHQWIQSVNPLLQKSVLHPVRLLLSLPEIQNQCVGTGGVELMRTTSSPVILKT